MKRLAIVFLAGISAFDLHAAVLQGWVFRDVNANGQRDATLADAAQDTYERGIGGITVAAINAAGASTAGTFTACTGRDTPRVGCVNIFDSFYTINVANGAGYRIELSGLSGVANGVLRAGVQSPTAPAGQAGSNSSVQFVTVAAADISDINFAVQTRDQYSVANPNLATSKFLWRDSNATGNAALDAYISFGYQSGTTEQTGTTNEANNSAALATRITVRADAMGATWGGAYDRSNNTLFAAAFTRRHVPLFSNGVGVGRIYRMSAAGGATTPSVYVDFEDAAFQSAFPNAVISDLDPGVGVDRDPHDNSPNYENDTQAWDNVGKTSFGDIDVSPDGTNLFAVALNDRRLYRIPVLATGTPTAATVAAFSIPAPSPVCTLGVARPFALGFNDGRGYVGVTCTGETLGGTPANLRAVVFEFDPAAATPTFAQVFNLPLNYGRGCASQSGGSGVGAGQQTCTTAAAEWRAWTTDVTCGEGTAPFGAQQICPQPMVSDINFDEYGQVTLAIADRLGWQTGNASSGSSPGPTEGVSAGDILRVARDSSGVWAIEASGEIPGMARDAASVVTTQLNPGGIGAGTFPAGVEFYWHDDYNNVENGVHSDVTIGGMVVVPGTGEVVSTAFDPSPEGPFRSGGAAWFSNWRVDDIYNFGERTRSYLQFAQDELATFGKAAGLGDLEVIGGVIPLQIGNRVWQDLNLDGVQDAGEPGIAGVVINLVNATGATIGSTTTDANGNWYFTIQQIYSGTDAVLTDSNVQLLSAALYGQSVSVMVANTDATGLGTSGSLLGLARAPATTNSGASGVGTVERDSNGVLLDPPGAITTSVGVTFNLPSEAGAGNHSVDFGFIGVLDYGDLPDSGAGVGAGNYETLLGSDGARNQIVSNLRLGVSVDGEADGVSSALAAGDNSAAANDENGATFPAIRAAVAPTIALGVFNNTGITQNLCGYIDFNNNGSFADAGEAVVTTIGTSASAQAVNLVFTGSVASATAYANNNLYSRFRVQTLACSPNGLGGNGEVEDYALPVSNVAIVSTAAGSYCPGQALSYTLTITNPATAATATAFPFTADLVGTNEVNLAGAPLFAVANWAVESVTGTAALATTSGSGDINTTVTIQADASLVIRVQGTFANATTGAQTASANVLSAIGAVDRNPSDLATSAVTQNTAAVCGGQTTGFGALCPNLGATGNGPQNPQPLVCSAAAEQIINTYYPGAAAVVSGSRCIQVGASAGSATQIAPGNLLLVVQMQDATILATATSNQYGDSGANSPGGATAATAGVFEYVIAQSAVQGTGVGTCVGLTNVIEISGAGPATGTVNGTINAYAHNPTVAQRETFQVVRVPIHTTVSFTNAACSFGSTPWNGSVGGIFALDATQSVDLSGGAATPINVSNDGFRGGDCAAANTTDSAANNLYAAASNASGAGKGEGYAGTPVILTATAGGYSTGDFSRGAPGNAGGGGQKCAFETVTGGGGGGGRSAGGQGANDSTGTCFQSHGGGILPTNNDASRLLLGGGGGCGAKDGGGLRAAGDGGGIVLIRVRELLGTGTIASNGQAASNNGDEDSAGSGGGGGGTMLVLSSISGANNYSGISFNATGGSGSPSGGGVEAAGGGGGGGNLYRSPLALGTGAGAVNVLGGDTTNGTSGVDSTPVTNLDPTASSPGVKPAYICAQNATVPVTLSNVEVLESGSELVVNFNTATEAGTLGFRVLADLGRGIQARVEIGSVASKTIDSLKEQSYSVRARNPGADQVWIEESSVDGKSELYGPYKVGSSVGEVGLAAPLNWTAINAEQTNFRAERRTLLRGSSAQAAELRASSDAWVRVTHEQLVAAGVDLTGQASNNIAVRLGSETVSARVSLGAKTFGAGSTIEFFAKAVKNSIYTTTAVYRIEVGRSLGLAEIDARTTGLSVGPEVQTVADTLVLNNNTTYSFSSPLEDPWFSFRALRSGSNPVGVGSINFTLKDRLAPPVGDGLTKPSEPNVGPETIEVSFWGGLDYAGSTPDHNAVFKLNGVTLGAVQFDGFAARVERFAVPSGVLLNGTNTFTVELPTGTGYAADIVNVESVSVGYTRKLNPQTDRFSVLLPATPAANATKSSEADKGGGADQINASTFVVTGLSGAPVVAVLERDGAQSVLKTDAIAAGSLRIELAALAGDRLSLMPINNSVLPSAAAALEDPIAGAKASYLIISHPSFIANLTPLILAKQQQGFSVKVVDVEAIYRYYSAGVVDPAAIQLAIRRAQQSLSTTHVLLVGGDTYDYQNVLGVNSVSFIPTNYRRTGPIIAFAPSDAVYADTDSNGVANVAIGRWPVRTNAELNALLGKTLSYQNTHKALFISDRSLNGISYANQAAPLANLLGQDWTTSQLSLDSYAAGQAATARADIVSNLEGGTTLLSYYGHSAPASWSREGLITASQVSGGLFNTVNQPFAAVQLGCWGTYFVEPTSTTVAHQMLLMQKGAAAVLGATSLTESNSDIALANHLLPRLSTTSLGDALLQSQQAMATELPDAKDVILGGTLLGDPALR